MKLTVTKLMIFHAAFWRNCVIVVIIALLKHNNIMVKVRMYNLAAMHITMHNLTSSV